MVTFANIVDQELARHISASLTIVPPTLLIPKVALEGRRAAVIQGRLAYNFLLVLGEGLEELCIEAESIDFESKWVGWYCVLDDRGFEANRLLWNRWPFLSCRWLIANAIGASRSIRVSRNIEIILSWHYERRWVAKSLCHRAHTTVTTVLVLLFSQSHLCCSIPWAKVGQFRSDLHNGK